MPPDSSEGSWSSARCRPTSRSLAATMAPMASGGRSVHSCSGSATFSPTVSEPNSAPDWNITPNGGRPEVPWLGASPSMVMRPPSGSSRPIR